MMDDAHDIVKVMSINFSSELSIQNVTKSRVLDYKMFDSKIFFTVLHSNLYKYLSLHTWIP